MPYGLFDYGGTINTMGAGNITTKMFGEEGAPPCPMVLPKACPSGYTSLEKGLVQQPGRPDCLMPKIECVKPPKCAPTYSSGACNYRLV